MVIYSLSVLVLILSICWWFEHRSVKITDLVKSQVKLLGTYGHELNYVNDKDSDIVDIIRKVAREKHVGNGNIKIGVAFINSNNRLEVKVIELHVYMDLNTYILLSSITGRTALYKTFCKDIKPLAKYKVWFNEATVMAKNPLTH